MTLDGLKMSRKIQIASATVLILLFAIPLIFESWLEVYQMPITGIARPAWILLFFASSILGLGLPIFHAMRKRFSPVIDSASLALLLIMWIAYPAAIRSYCSHVNGTRTDSWHWKQADSGLYYFVDRERPGGFAGLIEIYPPHISLPVNQPRPNRVGGRF